MSLSGPGFFFCFKKMVFLNIVSVVTFRGENNHNLQGVPDEVISNFIVLLKFLNISYHFLTSLKVKKR